MLILDAAVVPSFYLEPWLIWVICGLTISLVGVIIMIVQKRAKS